MRLLALLPLLAACSGGDSAAKAARDADAAGFLTGLDGADLSDPARVAELASSASAPNVFFVGYFIAFFTLDEEADCPIRTETATGTTYEGGCTAEDGTEFFGKATMTSFGITYEGFGIAQESEDCPGVSESWVVDGRFSLGMGTAMTFEVDLVSEGSFVESDCQTRDDRIGWYYDGTMQEDGAGAGRDLWNGEGVIGTDSLGVVGAQTVDEVLDDEGCQTEAVSGTTTLWTEAHEVVVTYDGATDCDPENTARWTLDGEDQGELEGIGCRAVPLAGSGWLGLIALIGLRRRSR